MDTTKNPNLETTHNHSTSSFSQAFKRSHEEICICKKTVENVANLCDDEKKKKLEQEAGKMVMAESGREKLKRHRVEMSGRVWIPEIWGQEELLKKWIDCTVFDSGLERSSILSARDALIQEGRSTLSIENSC